MDFNAEPLTKLSFDYSSSLIITKTRFNYRSSWIGLGSIETRKGWVQVMVFDLKLKTS